MGFFLEALTLGLLYGFGPCVSTCAPVIVPVVASTSKNYKEGLIATLIFSLAKVISYTILGGISGLLGTQFAGYVSNQVVGVIMILLAAFIYFDYHNKCIIPKVKITNKRMLFTTGLIMGFTPCGPMVAALAIAVASGSVWLGAMIGLIFGLGTVVSPLLIIGTISGAWAKTVVQNKDFAKTNRIVCSLFLVILGIVYIV